MDHFLKVLRARLGFSKKTVAELLGISVSQLTAIESGKKELPQRDDDLYKKMEEVVTTEVPAEIVEETNRQLEAATRAYMIEQKPKTEKKLIAARKRYKSILDDCVIDLAMKGIILSPEQEFSFRKEDCHSRKENINLTFMLSPENRENHFEIYLKFSGLVAQLKYIEEVENGGGMMWFKRE